MHFDDLLLVSQAQSEILHTLAAEVAALLQQCSEEECEPSDHDISSALFKVLKNFTDVEKRCLGSIGPHVEETPTGANTASVSWWREPDPVC
ncbi:uncharacterized protein PADG_11941 [Paracoccidioides brasiliensis Pb18]|uniref:Uncharacterized protein n=1 Tax=Paracoccidioides brasiliensis (strain Pb18) TaxID=502780 RepID=A0A0A0HUE1_PARBD|nr:uncharacterized protein PADG_11941 [Paracoccidioides brasiliensis Pb18]KGM91963.1 hypothetical protein PADG_11941 [Paracoccidioides brasiliensis Pb18]